MACINTKGTETTRRAKVGLRNVCGVQSVRVFR